MNRDDPPRGRVLGCILLISGLTATLPALASPPELEEVVVTATRREVPVNALPATVRLIDQETLLTGLATSNSLLEAVAQLVPGFSPTRQKLTGLGESMRGREPLYLIDGVPQSNPLRNGSRDAVTIDSAAVERVEVLYGANAIQGIGATGGIINYVTVAPPGGDDWALRYEAALSGDSSLESDGLGHRLALTAGRDFGAFDLVVSGAYDDRGMFRDGHGDLVGVDNTQGDLQNSRSTNLFFKGGWEPDEDTRLQLMVNVFDLAGQGGYVTVNGDRAQGVPTTSVKGEDPGRPAENHVRTASLDFRRRGTWGGTVRLQAYLQDFESIFGGGVFADFQDPRIDPTGTLYDQAANNSEKHGVKLAWTSDALPVTGLAFTLGADYQRDLTYQELIKTGRLWVPKTEFSSIAPFLQAEQALLQERLRLTAGLRAEFARLDVGGYETLHAYGPQSVEGGTPDFTEWLPNIGASYDLFDGLTAYASYSQGFTMPDVGRVLRAVDEPGQDVETLLDLQPVVADNTEVGLRFSRGRLRGSAAYFWSDSDLGQRLVANADGIFSVNRERTEIEGFEFTGEADVLSWLSLGLQASVLQGRYDSDGDGHVDRDLDGVNIGPDRLAVYAAFGGGPLSGRVQATWLDDRRFDDAGMATDFEGYALLDLTVGYDLGRFGRVDLGIANLLDEQYITYYSQTGTTSNARYFAGRGRTLTLRWSASY